jgi:hypothetical protein
MLNTTSCCAGVKYLCHSILFKIPKDIRVDGSSTCFMPNFSAPEVEESKSDSSYVAMGGYSSSLPAPVSSSAYTSAVESKPPSNTSDSKKKEVWLYGGDRADDAAALKAASHDLRGLIACYNTKTLDLHFPLMAIIDYRYAPQ